MRKRVLKTMLNITGLEPEFHNEVKGVLYNNLTEDMAPDGIQ
uniref:Uncharacterized protein n=1 Tax=Nelumbo nucifera TaxID=4432 RepID=A0A822Y9Y1_NELNU|nr:TPA_asm: hypothetical protein HUJ06_029537 [Nelumbo nucifera]